MQPSFCSAGRFLRSPRLALPMRFSDSANVICAGGHRRFPKFHHPFNQQHRSIQRRTEMEVILLERVAKLGQMGEVVRVKDGFARNFLLKRGKALRATADNKAKGEAAKVAEKIDGRDIVVIRQASESGQLFGSVTVRDIVEALAADGITVSRPQVWLDSPIKVIGQQKGTIAVHP